MNQTSYPLAKRQEPAKKSLELQGSERVAIIQNLLARALRHYDAEQWAEAEPLCLKILSLDVRHANALYVLGMVGYKTERYELAVRMIRRAIAVDAKQPFYHSNLGNALKLQDKIEEAIASYKQAIVLNPRFEEAHFNLGNVYLEQKKFVEAEDCYKQAVTAKPDYVDAWCNLGSALKGQKRLDEGLAAYEKSLALLPHQPQVHSMIANIHKEKIDYEKAVASFARAFELDPENAEFCCNLGDALHLQGMVEEAIGYFKQTLALQPDHSRAYNCMGNAYFDLGRLDDSVACCQKAVDLKPDFADAQMNVCLLQLLRGDYVSGWRNYEVRWKAYPPRLVPRPLWLGEEDLAGKRILLHGEQGLGDSLQFLRYVPMVQAKGAQVVLDLPKGLVRLGEQMPNLVAAASGDPVPLFDLHTPLMSLPLALGTTLDTVPAEVPYLTVPKEALTKAAALPWPEKGLCVGFAWTGNPEHPKNRARSVPLPLLEPIFNLEGVHFFSLQMGPAVAELASVKAHITDLAPVTGDMADTAAQMAQMDLIISIDTSMAHLAGALGKPLWVFLSVLPDWRWLLEREDSPWYPTARLFRQTEKGNWLPVIEKMRAALVEMVAQHPRS